MTLAESCRKMRDQNLLTRLRELARRERETLTELLVHLMEFDRRRLHAPAGYPSTFAFCTQALGYSEGAAYRRIAVARVARRYPEVLPMLANGDLHLEGVALLGPHLTADNCTKVLREASGMTKQQILFLVARLAPRPDGEDLTRPIDGLSSPTSDAPPPGGDASYSPPGGGELVSQTTQGSLPEGFASPKPAGTSEAPASVQAQAARQSIDPLSPSRVEFTFTGSLELLRMIERARELLRHKHPQGKLEDVIGEMAELFLERKDPERRALRAQEAAARAQAEEAACRTGKQAEPPNQEANRRIPQWVKNEVWLRDEGRCSFVSRDGQPCRESGGLEFDHVIPWALGGRSDQPPNIRLLCRAHNQWAGLAHFGPKSMRADGGAQAPPGPA